MQNRNVAILIPTLNPDKELPQYIKNILDSGFQHVIVVNDGSGRECDDIFESIMAMNAQEMDGKIVIFPHAVNLGKGRALKNGINYYLSHLDDKYAECCGIITVDSDGQHLVEDVIKVSDILETESKRIVVLGSRDFTLKNVPLKSRFGNRLTCGIFGLLFGKKLGDTQTGLRAFSNDVLGDVIQLQGERFEYETNVLIECVKRKISIQEVVINTVYSDNNSGTHFRPLVDSFKIYRLIFKKFLGYILASLSSFLVDCTLFGILCRILQFSASANIWIATIGARCVSAVFNYLVNKCIVFEYKQKGISAPIQYALLCVFIMFLSGTGVNLLYEIWGGNEVVIKCMVDAILFCVSYFVQDRLIFVEGRGKQ